METPQTKFQTSFVPKKPVIASQNTQFRKKSNLFFVLTLILFIATAIFAGGIFAYKLVVEKQIEAQKQTLVKANERFDKDVIARATRLNDRIMAVQSILDNHVSPSVIFELFEEKTLQTVRFKTLSFVTEPQKRILINATGVGRDLGSIVLQSDAFGETGVFKDVVFSAQENNNSVDFSFQTKIDNQFVLYSKNLNDLLRGRSSGNNNSQNTNTQNSNPESNTSTSTQNTTSSNNTNI